MPLPAQQFNNSRIRDGLALAVIVIAAIVVRLVFMSLYGGLALHEDSGPYLFEAERLLMGEPTTNGLPGRPPGYPLFLTAVIAGISPYVLAILAVQHLIGIMSALLLTLSLRMLGVGRLVALLFFIAVAFSHRLIHYDNNIGAETLTLFLMSLSFFLVCGMSTRQWNPWIAGSIVGLICAYMLLVRTGSFFLAPLLGVWLASPYSPVFRHAWKQRAVLALLVALPVLITGIAMTQWNKLHYERAVLSREVEPNMAFVIAYSGSMTGGIYADLKRQLAPIVEQGRASLKEDGYSTVENYQWVYKIFDVLSIQNLGSQKEKDKVVSALFWETLLTPETLVRQLTGHTLREMQFMLFDSTRVANSALPPLGNLGFMLRDSAHLRIVQTRYEAGTLIQRLLPSLISAEMNDWIHDYIFLVYLKEYSARPGFVPEPGLMRWYTVVTFLFIGVMLISGIRKSRLASWIAKNPNATAQKAPEGSATPHQIALLAGVIAIGNAFVACFFVYALHRYSYYVLPFNAFVAFYALGQLRGIKLPVFAKAGR